MVRKSRKKKIKIFIERESWQRKKKVRVCIKSQNNMETHVREVMRTETNLILIALLNAVGMTT